MKVRETLSHDLPSVVIGAASDMALPWQQVFDTLGEQIGILDEDWTVLATNEAWLKSASQYGASAFLAGTNYRQALAEVAASGLDIAKQVVSGIDDMIAEKRTSFRAVYQSASPEPGHEFELRISRFEVDGRKFASVIRYDVTRLLEFQRLRKNFSRSVISSQAEERRRIGRDIHDSTMQLTAAIQLQIAQLERGLKGNNRAVLDEMRQLVLETQQAIRTIAHLTHPPLLEGGTLSDATKALVDGFARRTGLEVTFGEEGAAEFSSAATDEAAYRIVQEALSNIHRHAGATHASVLLSRRKSILHVVISDDGVGIAQSSDAGVGLAGMRSRLSELGGRLVIRSLSPGTAIIASIPLKRSP